MELLCLTFTRFRKMTIEWLVLPAVVKVTGKESRVTP
jgi:hypothetical protein